MVDMPGAGRRLIRGLGRSLVGLLDRSGLRKDDWRQCVPRLRSLASTVAVKKDGPSDQDDGGKSGSQSGESFEESGAKMAQA